MNFDPSELRKKIRHVTETGDKKSRESLASFIVEILGLEAGETERDALFRVLTGQSPRKQGEKISDYETKERNRKMCRDIAYLCGNGLPAYTDSRKLKSVPTVEAPAEDACTIVADIYFLSHGQVRKIWVARDKDDPELKRLEYLGRKYRKSLPW